MPWSTDAAEPTAEADRGRHPCFPSFNVHAGGAGSLASSFGGTSYSGGEARRIDLFFVSAGTGRLEHDEMFTNSRREDVVGAIGVMVLLIGTATGNAYVMLGMSLTAIFSLFVFYRRKIGRSPILAAFVAAVTAAVVAIVVAQQ